MTARDKIYKKATELALKIKLAELKVRTKALDQTTKDVRVLRKHLIQLKRKTNDKPKRISER